MYDIKDWYWYVGGDQTQAFSTFYNTFVSATDARFQSWLAEGNTPNKIDTLDHLQGALLAANVPPYLSVSPRQARLALSAAGLLDKVNTAINTAGGATLITWEYATVISRLDPLIAQIGTALNLTSAQIDALFVQASTL